MQIRWLEQLQSDVPGGDKWLGPAERVRLAGLHIPKRRADWRLGRWTAKLAIAAWLEYSTDPSTLSAIEIIPADSGAPEAFIAGRPAPVSISISHREGNALCVVGAPDMLVGCDLEFVEERSAAFVSDYFTIHEQNVVNGCADVDRAHLLALLWSAKESTLKVLRTGLRLDTRQISVDIHKWPQSSGENAWRRLRTSYEGRAFVGWWRDDHRFVRTCISATGTETPTAIILARSSLTSL